MERYKAAIILPIIEAFSKGELIELKYHDSDLWEETNTLDVDSDICIYRIKPKPKLVPFTFEDNLLFKDKWFKYKDSAFGRSLKLVAYERDCVTIHNQSFNYQKFLDNYIFEDGSPCGKYVNE